MSEADLSRGFNASDETEKDNKPGHSQAAQDRQTDLAEVPNIIRDVQHIVSERIKETHIQEEMFNIFINTLFPFLR